MFVEPPQASGVDVLPPGPQIVSRIAERDVNGTRTQNPALNPEGHTDPEPSSTDPEPWSTDPEPSSTDPEPSSTDPEP